VKVDALVWPVAGWLFVVVRIAVGDGCRTRWRRSGPHARALNLDRAGPRVASRRPRHARLHLRTLSLRDVDIWPSEHVHSVS